MADQRRQFSLRLDDGLGLGAGLSLRLGAGLSLRLGAGFEGALAIGPWRVYLAYELTRVLQSGDLLCC